MDNVSVAVVSVVQVMDNVSVAVVSVIQVMDNVPVNILHQLKGWGYCFTQCFPAPRRAEQALQELPSDCIPSALKFNKRHED
jgi:hypothetical protein